MNNDSDIEISTAQAVCKWPYAIVDGRRKHISEAVRGEHGICPLCGAELLVREGNYRVRHWWHVGGRQCDPDWYEPKGPWHHYWQNQFPESWREFVMERDDVKHIADIRTPTKIVLEIQWSAISHDKILQREDFYQNMIWIAGMNRLARDRKMQEVILENTLVSKQGRKFHLICESDFPESQKWLYCGRPVFFDFEGSFDNPEGSGPLFYLMPKRKTEDSIWRYCLEVDREELITALREGQGRAFFEALKNIKDEHIKNKRLAKIEAERQFREAEIERRDEIAEEERQKAIPYFDHADNPRCAIEFANEKFHTPPRCALTLGWVEATLILSEKIEHDYLPVDMSNRAPYGRIAIHFAAEFSREEYLEDMAKAHKLGVDDGLGTYEELEEYKDRIVGCVDYLVKHCNGDIEFTFRRSYQIYRPGQKAYVWHRSGISLWDLPEKTQNYIGNVDLYSRSNGWF